MEKKTPSLFGDAYNLEPWKDEWHDMPEFVQGELKPFKEIILRFETQEDVDNFAKLTNQTITPLTKYLWYPEITIERYMDKRYFNESKAPSIHNLEGPMGEPFDEQIPGEDEDAVPYCD